MQVNREQLAATKIKLTITADQAVLDQIKGAVLKQVGQDIKVPGFRPGKAPEALIEKHANPSQLQTEFLEQAVNHLYIEAIRHEKLRPVAQPEINILKFVPFTTLEFTATIESVGDIKLADYKRFKLAPEHTPVATQDVTAVLDDLRQRSATRESVERAAKTGDEVVIDFAGRDTKTNEPISGADGKDYPLLLGSGSFIPGFEDKLIGLKPGSTSEFDITFPADYGVADLQKRKVTFAITLHKVHELKRPKADDAFAATAGPFQTLSELKADIKKQLVVERERADARAYENKLLQMLAEGSTITLPDVLVDEEIDRLEAEERRNIAYRGQTWQEHLDQEGVDAATHKENQRPEAERRLRAGLALAEVAEQEDLHVDEHELTRQIASLKKQYSADAAMLAEIDKPENRRDLAMRLLNQKVLDVLCSYAAKAAK